MKHALLVVATTLAVCVPVSRAADPAPDDLNWLRKQCGDGALAYTAAGEVYLTELSTGKTEKVGKGIQPEFSPDSSRLAWVDDGKIMGRLRKGDRTVHVIAAGVTPGGNEKAGGVHWLSDSEVVCTLRRGKRDAWYRVSLSGEAAPVPELIMMWDRAREADVKLCEDGLWVYVAGRRWKTSTGETGPIDGGCSCSLSPDGRSITALQGNHKECRLKKIREGGYEGMLKLVYQGSFDNHRWSSNDARFVVCVEERENQMLVMRVGETYCTRMGEPGGGKSGEMYGDFTVGAGTGEPWPKQTSDLALAVDRVPRASTPAANLRGPVKLTGQWPGAQTGLLFLWANRHEKNEVAAPDGSSVRRCFGQCRGEARIGPNWELDLLRGAFLADGVDDIILKSCVATAELTIEAVLCADNVTQAGPARIVSFSTDPGSRNFTLGQDKKNLVLRLRTPATGTNGTNPQVNLCTIEAGRLYHLLVTYRPGDLTCYLDGRQVLRTDAVSGDFSNWSAQHLVFGDEYSGGRDWAGTLEGVSIYDRWVDAKEARHHYALYEPRMKNRVTPATIELDARLVEMSSTPDPTEIAPYRRCLSEYVYDVTGVLSGELDSRRIVVNHWVILDGKILLSKRSVGQSRRLKVEPFESHAQLEAELRQIDHAELDLPRFYDVAR